MTQQHINLGTPPAGTDGDTNRTAWAKTEANFNELYGRGLPVGRNLLINPQGRINQRVFAGGALAAGVYGYDRWKAGAGGCNVTVSASTGIFTHTSGPLVQVIEAPRLAAQTVTFSVSDPSGPVGVNVDGVAGTITAGVGRRGVTLTLPPGSTGNVTLTITATGVTYKDPQLEVGDAATAFDARPIAMELALCQRYYEKSYNLGVAPGTPTDIGIAQFYATGVGSASHLAGGSVKFSVSKRAVPALTLYSPSTGASGVVRDFTLGGDRAAASTPYESGFRWNNSVAGGASNEYNVGAQWVADAEL